MIGAGLRADFLGRKRDYKDFAPTEHVSGRKMSKLQGWRFIASGPCFAWQSGYGAFTVSVSHIAETISYIRNQQEHHRDKSFQEEYVSFLKKHGIRFEERYLWD